MAEKNIIIVCGEPSGDLYAANLAKALLKADKQLKISAVGGHLLKEAGVEIIRQIKELAVFGIADALKKLPGFLALEKTILEKIKKEKTEAIILVDFSGFNLRLAKKINKKIPVIYYISPQVWASRSGRVRTIRKFVHKMLVFFNFEREFYRKYGLETDLIGHPLLDIVRPEKDKNEFAEDIGVSGAKPTLALLPGSRKAEIKYILPIMLKASSVIKNKIKNMQFILVKSGQIDLKLYTAIIKKFNLDLKISEGKTYDCLNLADFCLVASGTATLETTLMQKPFFIIYKMSLLNYLLYRPQVKIPYIGMANIIAQKKIIPEFIQFGAKPRKIAQEALNLLANPQALEKMKQELTQVRSALGEPGASSRATNIILNLINHS